MNWLLEHGKDKFCIQYIFLHFEGMEDSSKHLTGLYLNNDRATAERLYNEWFNQGKYRKELFFEKYPMDKDAPEITEEFARHEEWRKAAQINSTPTVLVNGRQMPEFYMLEDLDLFEFE